MQKNQVSFFFTCKECFSLKCTVISYGRISDKSLFRLFLGLKESRMDSWSFFFHLQVLRLQVCASMPISDFCP